MNHYEVYYEFNYAWLAFFFVGRKIRKLYQTKKVRKHGQTTQTNKHQPMSLGTHLLCFFHSFRFVRLIDGFPYKFDSLK